MSKSKLIIPFLVCILTLALGGCTPVDDAIIDEPPTPQEDIVDATDALDEDDVTEQSMTITALSTPEVVTHDDILAQELGEDAESVYYELTTTEDGTRVYRIVRASDGTTIELPAAQTVLYLSEDDVHYYEQVKYAYKADGVDTETTQYAIHAPDPDAAE